MKQTIKPVFILSELKPGGMERVVLNLAKDLKEKKHDPSVICIQGYGVLAKDLKKSKIPVKSIGSYKSLDLKAVFVLGRYLRKIKPSIISIHDYSSLPYAVAASLLFYRVPLVFTGHGLLYEGFDNLKKRCRFFSQFLSGFSTVSQEVAKRHKKFLNLKKNIEIIPNGVPFIKASKTRELIREELYIKPDEIFYLAVGNPRPEKGFEDLIDAASLILKNNKNFKFKVLVAGTLNKSFYFEMLEKKIKEKKLENIVTFLGFRSDTPDLYKAADVFVLSSRSEGMPMVILEAMMSGLPVVATKVGGVPSTIRDTGILTESANPQKLSEAMQEIIKNKDELGKKAENLAKKEYSIDKMTDSYLSFFKKIISGNNK
ncbi:MAG: glycosyltransferase [Desulforegulaceae bacterium]|nr:glycosyltransferase [Desulforegulaceae bacterium]